MFGGRGRGGRGGGGRGGRGGGGRGGGPRLPFKLTKEMFGEEGGGGAKGRPQAPRKERRKAERVAKGGGGGGRGGRGRGQHDRQEQQEQRGRGGRGGRGRGRGRDASQDRPAKRQRAEERPMAGIAAGSKFGELLPDHLKAAAGRDPEAELQRDLARKLGLKRGKTRMGGEDGLDEFLEELGGIDDIFGPGPSGEGEAEPAPGARQQQRQKRKLSGAAAAEAPTDSDEEEEEEEEGYGFESDAEDGLDGLLGSSEGEEGSDEELGGSGSEEGEDWGGTGRKARHGGGGGGGGSGSGSSDDDSLLAGLESEEEGSEEEDDEEGSLDGGSIEEDEEASGSENEGESGSPGGSSDEERPPQQQQQPAAGATAPAGKYVPPAARRAAAAAGSGGAASEAAARVERRVRGLLNRLAESNIQGIVSDLAALYGQEGRRLVSHAVCGELIAAAADGPRASDRFAAVTATAVAGLAGSVRSAEIVANFTDRLAARLEAAVGGGDSLCCHNLAMVTAHLYLSGALKADLMYSLLDSWRERFTEQDISMVVTLLRACGLQLRAADPVAIKELVVAVHARAAAAAGAGGLSKRAQLLLELVVDVKNNRARDEAKRTAVVLSPAIGKWLRGCGAADAAVGGITWRKVQQPNKKGIWWVPEATDAMQPAQLGTAAALRAVAAAAGSGEGGLSGPQLLQLAAALRMTTDARRAVFCVVMGSEDCVDAVEKLLRLGLKGEQEREVVRVTVECCLQEKSWNAYYAHLLLRLCGVGKSHKMTLQFCFWDQLKELGSMEVRRLTNLACLVATVVAGGGLPATTLKAADFAAALPAREVLFWRIFFEHLLGACKTRDDSSALFARIAAQRELKPLRAALAGFLRHTVGPWLASKEPGSSGLSAAQLGELLRRLRAAEQVLGSAA